MRAASTLLILVLINFSVIDNSLADAGKPDKTIHVESIIIEITSQRVNWWQATAQVTILDKNGAPVEGVSVTGDWDLEGTVFHKKASEKTNKQGIVEILSSPQRVWGGHVFTFIVTEVAAWLCPAKCYIYDETDNVETSDNTTVPLPDDEVSFPFQGIKRTHRKTTIPRPLNINVLEIDLNEPAIRFFVTPGGSEYDDRNTEIREEVLARRTSTFVAEYGLQVGINGDFAAPAEGPPYEYKPRIVLGLAVSNGMQYSTDDGWPALTLPRTLQSRTAYIGRSPFPADVYNAIGGNKMLVESGQPVKPFTWEPMGGALEKHPRTSAGISADGKRLIIIVIDGRQKRFSEGVTLPEMSEYLIEFGAYTGLNLDGGGSSTMVFENADGNPTIINYPSDEKGERIVSNHFGVISSPILARTNPGDINYDGGIDAQDALLALHHTVRLITLSAAQQQLADVSGEGAISALDAVLILQRSAGLIKQFPVEYQAGALILNPKLESEVLIETIFELERTPLNRRQRQVLEALKEWIFQTVIPAHSFLLQNYPNPFNPETWMPFQLGEPAEVTILIHNIKGEIVRSINLGIKPAGIYITRHRAAHWNGRTQTNETASSGIYYYTIKAGDLFATRKMILLK